MSTVVNGTAVVEVTLRDVVASWLETFYNRIPCNDGLVDIGADENGNIVGVWNFGTIEEPQFQSGKIHVTRKEYAVMEIATHLLSVLDLPDSDKKFVPAYMQLVGGKEENDVVECSVQEDGMARDSGERVLRSESEDAD